MSVLAQLKYGYDQSSNRTFRRDEVAHSHAAKFDEVYRYDGLERLIDFDRGELNSSNTGLVGFPSLTQDWTLDPTGNWNTFDQGIVDLLEQTRTHNRVNEIETLGTIFGLNWADPNYDAGGNMTSLPQPHQLDESYTATWDAWNRLVKLTDDANDDKTVVEYEYDGLNRRIVKKLYDDGSLDQTRHAYYSDQWQVLEERVDTGTSADAQYLWGVRYVDDLLVRDRDSERFYALSDALFNIVALTDDMGAVVERFAYEPYGESEALNPNYTPYSGSDHEWSYRFTGRELDRETGLQINRMRYLHLQLGTWISRDPIGYRGSQTNLYQYVRSRPLDRLDSHGLITITPINGKLESDCDDRNCFTQWSFTYPGQPPCQGWIVQQVFVNCNYMTDCCGDIEHSDFTYYEAWPGGSAVDTARFGTKAGIVQITYRQRGIVRFYCDDEAWNEIRRWRTRGLAHGRGPCRTSAGGLRTSLKKPRFWNKQPLSSGTRTFRYSAYCCQGDNVTCSASP